MTISALTSAPRNRAVKTAIRFAPNWSRFLVILLVGTLTACESAQLNSDGSNTQIGATPFPGLISNTDPSGPILQASVASPANYQIDLLQAGKTPYIDRDDRFTDVPTAYDGLCYIRTANDDHYVGDARFLVFNTNTPTTVYVGFDSRMPNFPAWLDSWTRTGDSLGIQAVYPQELILFRKNFPAGTVALNGNEMGYKTYTVLIKNQNPGTGAPCDIVSDKKITVSWLPVSEPITGYRIYFGTSKTSATELARNLSLNTPGLDPQAPAVKLSAGGDLKLKSGQNVCFRVSSLNENQESDLSDPMCAAL